MSLPSRDTPTKAWSLYQRQKMLSLLMGPTTYLTFKQHMKIRSSMTGNNTGNRVFKYLPPFSYISLFLKGSSVVLHHIPTAEMAVINLKWVTHPTSLWLCALHIPHWLSCCCLLQVLLNCWVKSMSSLTLPSHPEGPRHTSGCSFPS